MTTFWLITTALVLFSMAMVLGPIIMPAGNPTGDEEEVSDKESNIAYFREQTAELDAQLKAGLVSEEEVEGLRKELKKKLLADVNSKQDNFAGSYDRQQRDRQRNLPYALAAALLIPVMALPLYFKLGASLELDVAGKLNNPETTAAETLVALEQWSSKRPDNPQALFLLGSRHLADGNTDQAVSIYRQLYLSTDGHFQAAEQLAQALYLAGDRVMTDEIRRLVATTLAVDEMSPTALGLKGIDAFRQGKYQEAIQVWNQALSVEPNASARGELSARIRDARDRLGLSSPEVRVNVSLSPELASLPGDARVIVFARETGGVTPVAAVPLSVAELPREIVLDDSSAMMMHGNGLGDLKALDLVGRISMGGDVSHPDYEAVVKAVEVGGSGVVELQISPAT